MRIRRAVAGVAVAGLALAAVGCGSGGNEAIEGTGTSVAETTEPVPDRVSVCRPALVDTPISADELPVWPGPDPSEFLEPNPPSGECGEIGGEQASAVYLAALDNPDALWNVDGIVRWLVVDPLQ
ncbi:hypothetical protein EF834_12665 [Rhodococcus spongiicola]|uniref:DUF3558 domain-containing protein n=1 Tax=Rhodococcus spongiicola TaxID=2487352 RepID=A0A3S3CPD3_9NOCA|nr:hypothetical protein EF834_12665 [Rhodococcus spongiicola]